MKIKILIGSLFLLQVNFGIAQNEFIDTSFGTNGGYTLTQIGQSSLALTDMVEISGNIYASLINFNGDIFILKYDLNGLLDTTFGENGSLEIFDQNVFNYDAHRIGLLTKTNDNKLLMITGAYPSTNPDSYRTIATKVNLDGTLDDTYSTNGQYLSSLPLGIELIGIHKSEADEIVLVGYNTFTSTSDNMQNIIMLKLDAQGNLDTSFGNNGIIELAYEYQTYLPQHAAFSNQSVYILFDDTFGDAYITKYNLDIQDYDIDFGVNGQLEINNFNEQEDSHTFLVDNDNTIYIPGIRYPENNAEFELFIYKYSNGILDSGFGSNGIVNFQLIPNTNSSSATYSIRQYENKLLLLGTSYSWDTGSYDKTFFAQFTLDGNLDDELGSDGIIINYLFNSNNISYDYINYEDSIIACGSCPNNGFPQLPCLVKYLKDSNLSRNKHKKENIVIYPNPVDKVLNFNTNQNIVSIDIYDIAGRIIQSSKVEQNKVDINNLDTGVYFIKANTSNKTFTSKITKK